MAGRGSRSGLRGQFGGVSSGSGSPDMMEMFGGLIAALNNNTQQSQRNNHGGQGQSGPTLEQFARQRPVAFSGAVDPVEAEEWIDGLEKIYAALHCTDRQRVEFTIYKLAGEADRWWKMVERTKTRAELEEMTWEQFKELFFAKHFPLSVRDKLERDFLSLEQAEGETVGQYEARFARLSRFARGLVDVEERRARRFEYGLLPWIRRSLVPVNLQTYEEVVDRALRIELDSIDARQKKKDQGQKRGRAEREKASGERIMKVAAEAAGRGKEARMVCKTCGKSHPGVACYLETGVCFNCGKTGHFVRDCKVPRGACYNCGEVGHMSRQCPQPRKADGARKPVEVVRRPATARVFHMVAEEREEVPERKGKERLSDFVSGR